MDWQFFFSVITWLNFVFEVGEPLKLSFLFSTAATTTTTITLITMMMIINVIIDKNNNNDNNQ